MSAWQDRDSLITSLSSEAIHRCLQGLALFYLVRNWPWTLPSAGKVTIPFPVETSYPFASKMSFEEQGEKVFFFFKKKLWIKVWVHKYCSIVCTLHIRGTISHQPFYLWLLQRLPGPCGRRMMSLDEVRFLFVSTLSPVFHTFIFHMKMKGKRISPSVEPTSHN